MPSFCWRVDGPQRCQLARRVSNRRRVSPNRAAVPHVIIGTIFLIVCLARAYKGDFTPKHHFGFEAAAWYWHFVDVVWLFLFVSIYVWGGAGAPTHGG